MALIEDLHGDVRYDRNVVLDDLHPKSAVDAPEMALWLQSLLHCIHGKVRYMY